MRAIVLFVTLLSCVCSLAQTAPTAPAPAHRTAAKPKATPSVPAANLSWTQPSSGCSISCTYNVYRGPTSGSETLLVTGITGLTYQDTAVTRGSSYCYEVTAVNSVGESPKSNEVCVQIPVVPSAPALSVTVQ